MTRDRDQAIYYYIWRLLVLCTGSGRRGRRAGAVPTSLTISIMMMPYSC